MPQKIVAWIVPLQDSARHRVGIVRLRPDAKHLQPWWHQLQGYSDDGQASQKLTGHVVGCCLLEPEAIYHHGLTFPQDQREQFFVSSGVLHQDLEGLLYYFRIVN